MRRSLLLFVELGRDAVVVAHLLRDLHHVEVLEALAALDAEREVTFLAGDRVTVKSQLAQLMRILNRRNIFELVNTVVGEEYTLQALAVVQALNGLNEVPAQVDLGEADETAQIAALDVRDQVVGKIQHAQFAQVTDVLDLGDLIGVQIKHVQLRQILQVTDALNIILAQHEHTKGRHRMQMGYLLDIVVVEVEEDKRRQAHQVLNLAHVVVLQVQQAQLLLALEQRHMRQVTLVEDESVWIGVSLGRLAVHDQHARDLGQLGEDDLVLILDPADNAILKKVTVSLVLFISS